MTITGTIPPKEQINPVDLKDMPDTEGIETSHDARYTRKALAAFLALIDTPSSYSGKSGKAALVKAAEDGLEFAAPTPAPHTLASHSTKAHTELTGVTAAQHHARYTTAEAVAAAKTVKLDDFTAPDDNTDLDASTSKHGLLRKLDNDDTHFLDGKGAWATPAGGGGIGGLYGINIETLTGDKTLTAGVDKIYQYLDEGGNYRTITLDTASATPGDRFVIRHNGAYNDQHCLSVKQSTTTLDIIYAGNIKEFIFDGTNWIAGEQGSGENDFKKYNLGVGANANAYGKGTALGYSTIAYNSGVAVGYSAKCKGSGVAIGAYADLGLSSGYSIAIGAYANTNSSVCSIAIGACSKCVRSGETSITIKQVDSYQKYNALQGRWCGNTANGTPKEIHCAGTGTYRFTVRAKSALAFRITVVARDDTAGHVAMYTFEGLIKRDNLNNTVMSVCNKMVIHEDDATWDCNVTADDTNEALIITVTGDATNIVQWAAVLEGVETHF